MAPTRRRTAELREPKEEKPQGRIEDDQDEAEAEVFQFSFSEDGLTAKQCAEKIAAFTTKEEFLQGIPSDDVLRFITKALIGRKNQPLKCFNCERVYASSSGFMAHLKKCEPQEEARKKADSYRANPQLWLKVDKKDQKAVLDQIVDGNYACFSHGCATKCGTANALINHLEKCLKPIYFSFGKDRAAEFRQLDKKTKGTYIREALNWSDGAGVECILCGRHYSHQYGLQYHLDRCQIEKSEQPWKCYRCGFEAKVAQSEEHLKECARTQEKKLFEQKLNSSMLLDSEKREDSPGNSKRRRTVGGAIRATPRKDGTMLIRYRKSTVNREFNGIVTVKDQQAYEAKCSNIFENWKDISSKIALCERLAGIQKSEWETNALDDTDQLSNLFKRQSVSLVLHKVDGIQEHVPPGVRVDSRESKVIENEDSKATVAFCGAPINSIKVAPGKMENGDDVICVCTFANETTLESESSIVQFWRHRLNDTTDVSELELWFLLHLPNRGTILSMTWLQKNNASDESLIGFAAFSTTLGEVLIYRIDSSSVSPEGSGVQVVVAKPHLTLTLPSKEEEDETSTLNAIVKQEGIEETVEIKIDESCVPILKITWCAQDGGRTLVGLTAMGALVVWNLDEVLEKPSVRIESDWQSPPSDVSFMDGEHVAVSFREKLVKVINVHDWEVKLEENTMKTAGTRVHTDPRIVDSFFTFQSEYVTFPYPNANSIVYVKMMDDVGMVVLIPTCNTHQLMVWDAAICPSNGTLVSCGIDGRLVASASGRFLNSNHRDHTFFANRNVMQLKRRKVMTEAKSMLEILKEVKTEGAAPSTSSDKVEKDPLEESVVHHDDVCNKMWLEVSFDQSFEPGRPELSCRDLRIESLNCVDTNTDQRCPVAFTGGEAGLLFAISSKLTIKELDL